LKFLPEIQTTVGPRDLYILRRVIRLESAMAIATKYGLKKQRARVESCSQQAPQQVWEWTSHKVPYSLGVRSSDPINPVARSTYKCRETTCRFSRAEAGNRRLLKRNPKTRSLLRVDSLGLKPASPAAPVMSIVPLAAVRLVRTLLAYQSASEESV
jgi:hypothetical protein